MNEGVVLVLFGGFAVLLAAGAPIYLALGLSALACIFLFDLVPLLVLPSQIQGAFASFTLLAIPFFILAGNLLASSELTVRLIELARSIVGRLRGGLAIVAVITGVFFAGISGSGPADTAALSSTLLKPLERDGYDKGFAAALLAAVGAIGVIMPPSIALIIYGVVANASVGRLFMAGVLPALVVAAFISVVAVVLARRNGWGAGEGPAVPAAAPAGTPLAVGATATVQGQGQGLGMGQGAASQRVQPSSVPAGSHTGADASEVLARADAQAAAQGRVRQIARAFRRAFWGLMAPLIILGGIYSGVFTPTEAAGVVVLYAFFVGFVVYRDLKPRSVMPILAESVRTTGVVMIIIASASLFAFVLNTEGIASQAGESLASFASGKFTTLLVINIVLLLAGTFLDAISIFYIFVPILLPAAVAVGIDPVHFGIIATVNLAIGMVTPPVGVNLYVAAAIGDIPVARVVRAVGLIIAAELVALAAISAFPQLSLWLPDALGVR